MNRLSSLRTTLAPIPSTPMLISLPEVWLAAASIEARRYSDRSDFPNEAMPALFCRLRDLHPARGIQYRLDDVVVAGAAADVAFELVAHGGLVELSAMAAHDVDRRHDHARGAEAAL